MLNANLWELLFGFISLGTAVISFLLAMAVLIGNPKLRENISWSLASFSVAVWAGGLGFSILAADKRESYLWNQIF